MTRREVLEITAEMTTFGSKGPRATMKIERILTYFTDTALRGDRPPGRNRATRWLVQQYRLLFYTARGLIAHDTIVRSAALTFYTLISLVPILALVFAVVKGFGLTERLIAGLYDLYPQNGAVIDYAVGFARKALAGTQGGVLAAVGIVTLFWAVIRVFGSVESAFNNIWEVRNSRNLARRYINYFVLVTIAPILWLTASALGQYALQLFDPERTAITLVLTKLSAFVLIWGLFALLYVVVPNTKVHWRSALTAGLVAGTIFLLFQWGYVYLQQRMSSYNAIYGSFAALPLFLIWLQTSWEILLFGGELSFAYQNIDRFAEERESLAISQNARRRILLLIQLEVIRHFRTGAGALPLPELRRRLALPARIVNESIYQLTQSGLLIEIPDPDNDRDISYAPGRDIGTLSLFDLLETVENRSEARIDLCANPRLERIDRALEALRAAIRQATEQVLLTDLDAPDDDPADEAPARTAHRSAPKHSQS